MLVENDIIPQAAGAQLIEALQEIRSIGFEQFELNPELGDPLPNIENFITARVGAEVGGKLHTGRSRGDFYVAISRMRFRSSLLDLLSKALSFRSILIDLSAEHVDTLVPGYTHLQHAQPITLGHYFLAFVHQQERDFERLQQAYQRLNVSPMGLGIIGGSSYPLDRERTARLLGFDGLIRNGRDLSDRDYSAEIAADCSIMMMHVHRLATDLYIWSTSEFGMVRCDDSDVITSSIMPQKANPVLLETVLASTAQVHGHLMSVLGTLKGSSANNTEVGRADSPAMQAIDETVFAIEALGKVLSRMQVDRELMARRTAMYWAQATDLADLLVQTTGISFRQAHRIVGTLVSRSIEEGLAPVDVTPEMVSEAATQALGSPLDIPEDVVKTAIDPWQGVLRRRLLGGPAPEAVIPLIEEARNQLASDRLLEEGLRDTVTAAYEELERAAHHVTESYLDKR